MNAAPVHPLPVYPFPLSPAALENLKDAKAALDLPYRVVPVAAEPGIGSRVLAWAGELPPFLCEAALISAHNAENAESMHRALTFVLTAPAGADGSFDEADYLAAILPGTTEITDVGQLAIIRDQEERRAWAA